MKLAPIGLSTYTRIEHLKQTVNALKNCSFAKHSELFIFSDGPKPGDELKVERVRTYLESISGFKKIHIHAREGNNRVYNNRTGQKFLSENFGKFIFLEDDIVVSESFLSFMNTALNYFEGNESIFSISGYSPPLNTKKLGKPDVYFLPRFNAWGFGIWKNRYDKIEYIETTELHQLFQTRKAVQFIKRNIGDDALLMLILDAEGKIDALDVKAIYRQVLTHQFTVYPRKSLVQNIGHDGSGLHCTVTDKYLTDIWKAESFEFCQDLLIDAEIAKANRKFRRLDIKSKAFYLSKKYHIYKYLKPLKDAINLN
mgnify:CR=1 FL=1